MLSSVFETLSNNETTKGIIELIQSVTKKAKSSWNSSKYFRIVSIVTGSMTLSYALNRIYLKAYRKYNNMPAGPYGAPLIGQAFYFVKPLDLLLLGPQQCAVSLIAGGVHIISINNPHLMKKVYASSQAVDMPLQFSPKTDIFAFQNGEQWGKRRKIIYANLMSTMKAQFVENVTKQFIKNKVFNVFDGKIEKNEKIAVKELLRPLGFNIILQACFGQELKTLNDPFWLKYNELLQEMGRNASVQGIIITLCGGENKFSHFVMKCLGMRTMDQIWSGLSDLTEAFAMNEENNLKRDDKDENVKTFNDYIEEYASVRRYDSKHAKKQLFGDMTAMFMAATDTTYSVLGFCLLMAAKHPLIQQELYDELKEAFGGNIDNFTLADGGIAKIPKLRAFVHEVMRIYPPAIAAGFREMTGGNFKMDADAKGKSYDIPKGCCFMMNTMMVHYTPQWWVRDYDPSNKAHAEMDMKKIHFEFWLDAEGKFNKNSLSFLTFSKGKRDCVGQSLAMKELYIVMAMTFMKYEVFGPNGDDQFEVGRSMSIVQEPMPDKITLKLR